MKALNKKMNININIRTLLIWEAIAKKDISTYTNDGDDLEFLKYASYVSGGNYISFPAFKLQYGSFEFRESFDALFNMTLQYFLAYGKPIFEKNKLCDVIKFLLKEQDISYESVFSKMTFHEIKFMIEQ